MKKLWGKLLVAALLAALLGACENMENAPASDKPCAYPSGTNC